MHYDDPKIAKLLRDQGVEPEFVVKPKKRHDNEESRIQQTFVHWWGLKHKEFGVPEMCLFAIGNGGARSPITGAIMKREGVRSGVSDLFLSVPRGKFHGMYIEMKKPGGRLRPEQRDFFAAVGPLDYHTRVAYSVDDAIEFVTGYLRMR